jgi:hypothetical protein
VQASVFGMGFGRYSTPLRGVGVTAMPNAGLDTTRRVKVTRGSGVLQLPLIGVVVVEIIDGPWVVDGVVVTR